MYPFARVVLQMARARKMPPLDFNGVHESHHICWPWDLDIFMELNNGRALTFYDLGRIPLGQRVGLLAALRRRRWGLTVAGSSVRYRRRIRAFQKFRITSRGVGWDDKFFYIEQAMWLPSGECAGHVLIRSAGTGPDGIVPPKEILAEMGHDADTEVSLPDWVNAWIEADAKRPWPPMPDAAI